MQYKVVKDFKDMKDDHVYRAGDLFPRPDANVGEERIKELSSKNNKRGEVLIVAVEDKEEVSSVAIEKAPEEKKRGKRNARTNTEGDKGLLHS